MKGLLSKKIPLIIGAAILLVGIFIFNTGFKKIDFNTEVKPIFNKKCITCHGGVKRKAGFSLLFRSDALANTESGKPAIVPGHPEESEMIRRLTLSDPEERMPFKHDPLSKTEINTLTQWVKEGAEWGDHWAYLPVKSIEIPSISSNWLKNPIDNFILNKLNEEKLSPSVQADKATLLRRASLDLVGMPTLLQGSPKGQYSTAFLKDSSSKSYEILVDSLLNSKHFGEKWAAIWLDLARYADTKGYERDDKREIWRYRDWLIKAFNDDKPYDQFLTEQIAGDLLPNPNDDQLIATAFHRNTMTNDEGGTENEEFRTAAVIDRVNTTWEALMGTTFACVQCHSHPYDPFRHEEYYKFMAFFNNTRYEDTHADYPLLRHFNDTLQHDLAMLNTWVENNASKERAAEMKTFIKTGQPAINSLLCDSFTNSELSDTKWLAFRQNAVCRLKNGHLEGKDHLMFRYSAGAEGGVWTIHLDNPNGRIIATIPLKATKGWQIAETPIESASGVHDLYFTYTNPHLKKPEQSGVTFDWFYFTNPFPAKGKEGYEKYKNTFWNLVNAKVPTTPIMMDNPSDMYRETHVFERGNWLVKGEKVTPSVPKSLNPMPKDAPNNRLGLAMWLTDKQNPLTARTLVNRLWEQLYGTGLVETLEDLGTQGAQPTHRELLDYLAFQFMTEYKWSIKKLLKTMVMSATYQQDSKVTAQLLEKDPNNRLYARGARVRLSAEQVRDQSLAICGVLNEKMYGKSVMPWQPEGIWLSPWSGEYWVQSKGEEAYRRAVYTYWKRTAPYPSMMTFDGAAREVCTSRRIRTNTPLQALVTLNDSAYIEMARLFAYKMKDSLGTDVKKQISGGYEWAMYKPINAQKLATLEKLYDEALRVFKNDTDKSCEMVGGYDKRNKPETAALVVVANAMLNLDEFITKN